MTYATKQGWQYETILGNTNPSEATSKYPMRAYADNFLPRVVSIV